MKSEIRAIHSESFPTVQSIKFSYGCIIHCQLIQSTYHVQPLISIIIAARYIGTHELQVPRKARYSQS